jgi:hypothetical protein
LKEVEIMATEVKKIPKKQKPVDDSPIDVEQDIWVQLPPIKEFTVTLKLEYLGQAKPLPLPDELLEI